MVPHLFLAPESWPFTASLLVLLAVMLIEGTTQLIGFSGTGWLDSWLLGDGMEFGDSWLGWLHPGKVPLLVLLVLFLTTFSLLGYGSLLMAKLLFGAYPPAWLSSTLSAGVALPSARAGGAVIARYVPRDETSAVRLEILVGRVATVVNGTARADYPAQARVRSDAGQQFYVHVEPDDPTISFVAGDAVLLVRQLSGARFQAIANPRPDLL
jgi:hypothetical protein